MGSERSEEKFEAKWIELRWKDFKMPKASEKMRTAQAFERVSVQDFKNAFVEHLGVSDVDFDPKNGSRMEKVAKSEI